MYLLLPQSQQPPHEASCPGCPHNTSVQFSAGRSDWPLYAGLQGSETQVAPVEITNVTCAKQSEGNVDLKELKIELSLITFYVMELQSIHTVLNKNISLFYFFPIFKVPHLQL